MPSPTSSTMSVTALGVLLAARDRHLQVVEHVVVGLTRGLQVPGLARRERVQRQLHVVAELLGPLRRARSCSRSARTPRPRSRQAVDAVDAPAQVVRPEPEGERALEPHRLGVLPVQALVVARQRRRAPCSRSSLSSLVVAEAGCGASRRRAAPAAASASRRRRSDSARAPGARRCRSAGAASARWGCAGRARTCSAAGSCGRSRCPRPTAPARRPCAAGTARASARRACRSAGRAWPARARRRASRRASRSARISRWIGVVAASRRALTSASASPGPARRGAAAARPA